MSAESTNLVAALLGFSAALVTLLAAMLQLTHRKAAFQKSGVEIYGKVRIFAFKKILASSN
jgi:hypothetical protein